jgi:hypothetical protein
MPSSIVDLNSTPLSLEAYGFLASNKSLSLGGSLMPHGERLKRAR